MQQTSSAQPEYFADGAELEAKYNLCLILKITF
jgi:hypothetical protein